MEEPEPPTEAVHLVVVPNSTSTWQAQPDAPPEKPNSWKVLFDVAAADAQAFPTDFALHVANEAPCSIYILFSLR